MQVDFYCPVPVEGREGDEPHRIVGRRRERTNGAPNVDTDRISM